MPFSFHSFYRPAFVPPAFDAGKVVARLAIAGLLTGASLGCGETPIEPNSTASPNRVQALDRSITMIDLGSLDGTDATATAVTEKGEVVGHFLPQCRCTSRAFLGNAEVLTDLGNFGDETFHLSSIAADINTAGTIVGTESWSARQSQWSAQRAFKWDAGVVTYLTPLTHRSSATAINIRGQIVGAVTDDLSIPATRRRAFLWEEGRLTDLGTLGGAFSEAGGINSRGQVVGSSRTASNETHAFLWEKGQMVDLGTLGGSLSRATDINDAGQIVGMSTTAAGRNSGFLWDKGKMTNLGDGFFPSAINSSGQIVGMSTIMGEWRAVLWDDGQLVDLGTVAGGSASGAQDISDRGQIVGWGGINGGFRRAVMWTIR